MTKILFSASRRLAATLSLCLILPVSAHAAVFPEGDDPATLNAALDDILTSSPLLPEMMNERATFAAVHRHDEIGLHFSHPMVGESPSPDTKLRFDFEFRRDTQEENVSSYGMHLEAEYAFARWISVELSLPYSIVDPDDSGTVSHFDSIALAVKTACYAFEDSGVLFGGGIEIELPTGDEEKDIGSDHVVTVAPFIDAGWKGGDFEITTFVHFEIPTNQNEEENDEVELEIGYDLAILYHIDEVWEALLEFEGSAVAIGDEDETILNIAPGVKVKPFEAENLQFGLSVAFPLTSAQEYDVQGLFSIFYHF